jgi:iron complex transport system substrate-binding protein
MGACGDSGDPPETTVAPAAEPAFPVTVEAGNGPVTIAARPDRIVSLSATHTEVLYAIGAGDQVAGTDLTSNFPPAADATEKVDAFNFNVEEVAALDPDLVVLAFDFSGEVTALDALGIPSLLLSPALTLKDAYDQIAVLGSATGHTAEAAALAAGVESGIAAAVASVPAGGPRSYFHEVDNTLFSANSTTFLGDLYGAFGMDNIADAVPDEFASGYVQVSAEFIIEANPDFIFLGDAGFGESAATVADRPGWETLAAVQGDRVIELDSEIAGRWGPRSVDLAEQIAAALIAGSAGP